MGVARDKRNGKWRFRRKVRRADGTVGRLSGTPVVNTKQAALMLEQEEVARFLTAAPAPPPKREVETLKDWFHGRFWDEHVLVENGPGEQEQKRSIYRNHLGPRFGHMRIDEIDTAQVLAFRADLLKLRKKNGKAHSRKTHNNILGTLSTALRYAVEVEVLDRAPRAGIVKVEASPIEWCELQEYARLLAAAREYGGDWYAAACLAGEAGLRIGEVRALDWQRDVDMTSGTITVNKQIRHGELGPPKGRERRTVPMTSYLKEALRSLSTLRRGFVVRNQDGTGKTDSQTQHAMEDIAERAGVKIRGWHVLRHSFATHAAMFGINPWKLQAWLGHKSMDMTQRYVHVAEAHAREQPAEVLAAGQGEADPDRRVLRMLAARANVVPTGAREAASGE